jgi:adenylate cyclase class IV
MEELNYHKLLNLRKRFDKYIDCPAKQEIVDVICKFIEIEKKVSKEKDLERRAEYQNEIIECPYGCGKEVYRKSLYKHKKQSCPLKP